MRRLRGAQTAHPPSLAFQIAYPLFTCASIHTAHHAYACCCIGACVVCHAGATGARSSRHMTRASLPRSTRTWPSGNCQQMLSWRPARCCLTPAVRLRRRTSGGWKSCGTDPKMRTRKVGVEVGSRKWIEWEDSGTAEHPSRFKQTWGGFPAALLLPVWCGIAFDLPVRCFSAGRLSN